MTDQWPRLRLRRN